MLIKIDTTSAVPVYAQIVNQVKHLVAKGVLKSGDCLPSLRETAMQLRVNPLTVAKAYKQLEIEGLIETQQGKGSYISNNAKPVIDEFKQGIVEKDIERLIYDAFNMKIDLDELKKIFNKKISLFETDLGNVDKERKSVDEN